MNNIQTFSQRSDQYAQNRPQYPEELFAYLSRLSPGRDRAWDCATGNGQAAVGLARYFSEVAATDISPEQIRHRRPLANVRYCLCPAEWAPFVASCFDLITVATAVHWFEPERFHAEVERVLRPGGLLAVWTYGLFRIEPQLDHLIRTELLEPIDPYWASGNRQAMSSYRDLALPFEDIRDVPAFVLHLEWTADLLLAYLQTWSAVKRYAAERGTDPVEAFAPRLREAWPKANEIRLVQMPLSLRVCRKPG